MTKHYFRRWWMTTVSKMLYEEAKLTTKYSAQEQMPCICGSPCNKLNICHIHAKMYTLSFKTCAALGHKQQIQQNVAGYIGQQYRKVAIIMQCAVAVQRNFTAAVILAMPDFSHATYFTYNFKYIITALPLFPIFYSIMQSSRKASMVWI